MTNRPDIKENISLKHFNTFGLEVRARYFVSIRSEEDLRALTEEQLFHREARFVLGGGSNILFTKDFDGIVLHDSIEGISVTEENDDSAVVRCGGGERWHSLVQYCIEKNLSGIENLSLIPGTAGAAPIQNIGAYGVELRSVFDRLEAVDLNTGRREIFDAKACGFGYRDSVFKHGLKNKFFITCIFLRLNKNPEFRAEYGALQSTLDSMFGGALSIRNISEAVIHIRRSKLPDPAETGNAGSFFKNPEIPAAQFTLLSEKFPEMPGYAMGDKIKVPAGWLIEQCGWKGKRVGNTGSHARQALVLVNYGEATGKEILDLAHAIQDSVEEKFGIHLDTEVHIM